MNTMCVRPSLSSCLVSCAALAALLRPAPAEAQVIGTFSWQAAPYCNLLTLTVTVEGAAIRSGSGSRALATFWRTG